MTFTPTVEQVRASELFDLREPMKIIAGAGTGKTATLKYIADEHPDLRGQYVAFNRALVDEAKAKFPDSVSCRTSHSLAYGAIGWKYKDRLGAERKRARDLVRALDARSFIARHGNYSAHLDDWQVVNVVMGTVARYCQSADRDIGEQHIPVVAPLDPDHDKATWAQFQAVILPMASRVWRELQDPNGGTYRFTHDHYMKIWEQSEPYIDGDYLLIDEAQDVNPVLESVLFQQADRMQMVAVGDPNQTLYEWRNCVNSMERMDTPHVGYLTQSFRFGQRIADYANQFLSMLSSDLRLVGLPGRESVVEPLAKPDAILTRTNATAVARLLSLREEGNFAHLVGGGEDVIRFCSAAMDLKQGRKTTHPELMGFDSWSDVIEYVNDEEDGADLKLLVDLTQRYGPLTIKQAIQQMPVEEDADLVLSTLHKSKGRQWPKVQLAGDFSLDDDTPASELRILYVACTRAEYVLDPGMLLHNPQLMAVGEAA